MDDVDKTEWELSKEFLPMPNVIVWVADGKGHLGLGFIEDVDGEQNWYVIDDISYAPNVKPKAFNPTHWMYLDEPDLP